MFSAYFLKKLLKNTLHNIFTKTSAPNLLFFFYNIIWLSSCGPDCKPHDCSTDIAYTLIFQDGNSVMFILLHLLKLCLIIFKSSRSQANPSDCELQVVNRTSGCEYSAKRKFRIPENTECWILIKILKLNYVMLQLMRNWNITFYMKSRKREK